MADNHTFGDGNLNIPSGLLELIMQRQKEDAASLAEYRAAEAAGFPGRNNASRNVSTAVQSAPFNVSNVLIVGCHFCRKVGQLSRCSGCKVVHYCSQEHQTVDRAAHKVFCNKVKKERIRLEAQEVTLRAHPGDFDTPPNAFAKGGEGYGRFWGYKGTRPYMKARYSLIDALMLINTKSAVEAALEHCLDMLHLNHSDNQGMRTIIPALYLRLGSDQDCYNFLHWWFIKDHLDSCESDEDVLNTELKYIWGDARFPVTEADAFQPVVGFLKEFFFTLPQLVSLTLVKVRMLIDMRNFYRWSKAPDGTRAPVTCVSDIIEKNRSVFEEGASEQLSAWLKQLVIDMYVGVWSKSHEFWSTLLKPGNALTMKPDTYMMGSSEEMQVTLQKCYNSWAETPGAFDVIEEMGKDPEVLEELRAIRDCNGGNV